MHRRRQPHLAQRRAGDALAEHAGRAGPAGPSGVIVPGTYSMDTIRTCTNGAQCGTREVPAGIFQIGSEGVTLNQMRGYVRFSADGTFSYESVQRTDSPFGKGPERTLAANGTFNVTESLIGFRTVSGTGAPGTMTISTDGTLLRFYDIPIELPYVPQTIQVTETYRLVRE